MKDANNNTTTYGYDGFDRLQFLYFPHPSTGARCVEAPTPSGTPTCSAGQTYEQYGYDASGNRTSLRKRDGRTIAFQYDPLDREILKDLPGTSTEDVYSTYDLAGQVESKRFGSLAGQGVTYAYDPAKRLQSESTFGRTMTYGYDVAGNRNRIEWPDAHYISYSFDVLNRMTEVRENSSAAGTGVLQTYSWDALSRRSAARPLTRGNGTTSGYDYDQASRLLTLGHDLGGTTHDATLRFTYTPASQLSSRYTSNNALAGWTAAAISQAYVPNALNQYASRAGVAFSYDGNGNLLSDGARTFGYDVENRLTSVAGSSSMALTYDPLGRLRQTVSGSTTTQFLYDGNRLVAEYTGSGTLLRRYAHGAGIDEPIVWYEGTDKRWLHQDERGSIIAHTNASGSPSAYHYGPYGEQPATGGWSGSRFSYTGQIMLPEVQLYHYKARVYDPAIGRFLQTDPVGYQDGFNLYAYVGNDPLNRVDPTGMWWDIPQPIVDFSVGLGDVAIGATLGLMTGGGFTGPDARVALGIDGGVTESGAYKNGVGAGLLGTVGLGRLAMGANVPVKADAPTQVTVSRSQYPESAAHIKSAQEAGKPSVLTVDRSGAASRRSEALKGTNPVSGKDRDEYPPAMFKEGGKDASVRAINPSDNRGAGSSIGRQCRSVTNGGKVEVTVCD